MGGQEMLGDKRTVLAGSWALERELREAVSRELRTVLSGVDAGLRDLLEGGEDVSGFSRSLVAPQMGRGRALNQLSRQSWVSESGARWSAVLLAGGPVGVWLSPSPG